MFNIKHVNVVCNRNNSKFVFCTEKLELSDGLNQTSGIIVWESVNLSTLTIKSNYPVP